MASELGELRVAPPRGMSIKDIDQYFGVWAIESKRANDIMVSLQTYAFDGVQAASREYEVSRSPRGARIANVEIRGVMTKRGSSLSDAGSTVAARRAISQAAADPKVDGIFLRIESPGGSVAGTAELGEAVRSANTSKPVVAYIEDIGASAAYWVASQAGRVYANKSAEVGSIGVFMVVADQSRLAENMGVVVHVVKAGKFKGAGTPGTQVTEEQLQEFQRRVNTTYAEFKGAIAQGRPALSVAQVDALSDGRVHSAPDAVGLGLIDGVKSEAQALADLEAMAMASESDRPRAATAGELRSTLVGCDGDTLLEILSAGMSLEDAKDHWILAQHEALTIKSTTIQEQADVIGELRATNGALLADNETLKKRHTGLEPVGAHPGGKPASGTDGSALAEWKRLIGEEMAKGLPRGLAASKVARTNPGLRQRVVDEANAA